MKEGKGKACGEGGKETESSEKVLYIYRKNTN